MTISLVFDRDTDIEEALIAAVPDRPLSEDHVARTLAADGLVESDLFAGRGGVVAIVVAPLPVAGRKVDEGDRLALGAALRAAAATMPVRESMVLIRPGHGLLVVTQRAMERASRLADELCSSAAQRLGRADRVVWTMAPG